MNPQITKKEVQELFLQNRAEELSKITFEYDFSDEIKGFVRKAMMNTSILKIGVHESTYENLITFDRKFFMPEIDIMLCIIRGATPAEMGQTLEENLEMIKSINPIIEKWRDSEEKVSGKIMSRINANLKIFKGVPISKAPNLA